MKRLAIALGILAATADAGPYASGSRVAYLAKALDALRTLGDAGRGALELALHEASRAKCHPTARAATTTCMIEIARGVCARHPDPVSCTAAADIVSTNQHAESELVGEQTRMRLVRTSSDYHAAINAELLAIYALLAAELVLVAPGPDTELPDRIDRFCAERDFSVHRCAPGARGCVPSIAYQRCAAGLVWYVTTVGEAANAAGERALEKGKR